MTNLDALREGYSLLQLSEVETPLLDAAVLIAEVLGITKEKLFASLTYSIKKEDYNKYREYLDLRCSGIPVSYIRKKKEFYSIEYYVDERVFIPRPDTEVLVDRALALLKKKETYYSVHEVCTGSGCIAITLNTLIPGINISVSDISEEAKNVFQLNCMRILCRKIPFSLSDLLVDVKGKFDLIISNPPYIRDEEVGIMKKGGWPEPDIALKGGSSGITISERLIQQAIEKLNPKGFLLLESSPENMTQLAVILADTGFKEITITKDLGGRDRVICGRYLL